MNYSAMFDKINSIHKKTGKSRIAIFWDMQECARKYGAGYMDYDLFEMYSLTDAQRDTYLTRGRNNELMVKYNDRSFVHFFDNKNEFYTLFGEFMHRDWVHVIEENKEKVSEFLKKHPKFIAKPINGSCGVGIKKYSLEDDFGGDVEKAYKFFLEMEGGYELEELIRQHPSVSSVYPESINTVRAVTINNKGNVKVVCTYFRIGNNGKSVDNFNNGGMVVPVDEVTGIVKDRAIDKNKVLYEVHPYTNTTIKGFKFPDWDKALEMVKKAATVIPEMGYIGWDVAFSEDGPLLVEGNDFPGHDIYQLPEHTPDKIGIMEKFRF